MITLLKVGADVKFIDLGRTLDLILTDFALRERN
jgi:hypothetical protein